MAIEDPAWRNDYFSVGCPGHFGDDFPGIGVGLQTFGGFEDLGNEVAGCCWIIQSDVLCNIVKLIERGFRPNQPSHFCIFFLA